MLTFIIGLAVGICLGITLLGLVCPAWAVPEIGGVNDDY